MGVLIDDLITSGTSEPYRMFTSRAEYRLLLREDNADLRLTETGRELGLVDDRRWQATCAKREAISNEQARLSSTWLVPAALTDEQCHPVFGQPLRREASLMELLRRPEVSYQALMTLPKAGPAVSEVVVAEQVEIQAKYHGYIERQAAEIEKTRLHEQTPMPADFDYSAVRGLSAEVSQKLEQQRPVTLGQAARISGVTPAAISLLLIHLKKRAHWALRKQA
tara:strand:- start:642 stop:1310 length:669 start_codon:yes stop_codon:yes gene_type:complete